MKATILGPFAYALTPKRAFELLFIRLVREPRAASTPKAAFTPTEGGGAAEQTVFMDNAVFQETDKRLVALAGEQYIDQGKIEEHEAERDALQEKFDNQEEMTLSSAVKLARMYIEGPIGCAKDINKAYETYKIIESSLSR